ncbi:hypothetical protein MWLf4_2036 [Limosilactobacillus fermentum]|nr:hypothetical protein MWLf4_2036 [Limosilactobacillus fermentum]
MSLAWWFLLWWVGYGYYLNYRIITNLMVGALLLYSNKDNPLKD